jgi:multicomponent Na+:H+ antiporter subunit E
VPARRPEENHESGVERLGDEARAAGQPERLAGARALAGEPTPKAPHAPKESLKGTPSGRQKISPPMEGGGTVGGPGGAASAWVRAAAWAPPLAVAWWSASEGRSGSWGVGAPVVLLAAWVAAWVLPWPRRWVSPLGLAGFLGWFVRSSVRGGLDVAWRALAPSMPLAPGFVELRTTLPEGAGRVLLADLMSLLPGTLTVEVTDDVLLLHGLEVGPAVEADFRELESRIARLLGVPGSTR